MRRSVARAGLRRVAQAFVVRANAALEDSNPGEAERLLVQATALAPDLADLRVARIELRELRERLAIASSRVVPSEADMARLRTLVDDAVQASEAGRLIEPPGNCAYDKYRAALAIDGNHAAALDGLSKLPARARTLFEQAMAEKPTTRARAMLEALVQLSPADAGAAAMRTRLADAYFDEADANLAQQRADAAARALKSARELAPSNPRAAALEQRLAQPPSG